MMMMMASDHQPRQAPTQWQWGEWSGGQLGRLTQVRSSAKISSFMMMDVDGLTKLTQVRSMAEISSRKSH